MAGRRDSGAIDTAPGGGDEGGGGGKATGAAGCARGGARVPLYVISRDGAPERLVALWAEAERMGVPLVRVGASDGAPGDDEATMRASDHRRAWERVAAGEDAVAIVLEDDVALDDRLAPLLDADALAGALPPLGLVRLDGGCGGEGEARIERATTLAGRCGAYALRRETAAALLAAPRQAGPLERWLVRQRENGLSLHVAVPAPVAAPDREDEAEPGRGAGLRGFAARLGRALRMDRASPAPADRPAQPPRAARSASNEAAASA